MKISHKVKLLKFKVKVNTKVKVKLLKVKINLKSSITKTNPKTSTKVKVRGPYNGAMFTHRKTGDGMRKQLPRTSELLAFAN